MERRIAQDLAKGKYSNDFFIRDRSPNIVQMLLFIGAVLAIAIFTTYTVDQKLALTALLFILFGCISWYATLNVRNNHDLVQATEFQNAVFASALGMNHDFCFIVGLKDRDIFYFDRPFQTVFPHFFEQPARSLEAFFDQASISPENRQAFISLLDQGSPQNIVLDVQPDDKSFKATFSLEPIPRPKGFVLVRGRKL